MDLFIFVNKRSVGVANPVFFGRFLVRIFDPLVFIVLGRLCGILVGVGLFGVGFRFLVRPGGYLDTFTGVVMPLRFVRVIVVIIVLALFRHY